LQIPTKDGQLNNKISVHFLQVSANYLQIPTIFKFYFSKVVESFSTTFEKFLQELWVYPTTPAILRRAQHIVGLFFLKNS
jgi:hypothetical protein